MDDGIPINESSDEVEVSPNDNCEDALQDQSHISGTNPTLREQDLSSIAQDSSENQQLRPGIFTGTSSGLSVSFSQIPEVGKFDAAFSRSDIFYSSRKFRIRTKCSRFVDAILSSRQHKNAYRNQPEEAGRNTSTLANQVLPSVRVDASQNQQLSSGISTETSSRPSVFTVASLSEARNIDQLDETFTSTDVFYSSREPQIRSGYSQAIGALLSPRQFRRAISLSVLGHQDFRGAWTNPSDRSLPRSSRNIDPATPPELVQAPVLTRSVSKALNVQKTISTSPQKRIAKKNIDPKSTKKRKTSQSYCRSRRENESYKSKLRSRVAARTLDKSSFNLNTQEKTTAARENEASVSLTEPPTVSPRKRKTAGRSYSDSKTAKFAFKPRFRFLTSDANIDYGSPTILSAHERNVSEPKSDTEAKTSISFQDHSTDSNSPEKHSNPNESHQSRSIGLLTEEEATMHSNPSTDVSSTTINKETEKHRERSPVSDTWCIVPSCKFSNSQPPTSCHLPEQSSSSNNVSPRLLKLETSLQNEGSDRNRSDSATRTSAPNAEARSESETSINLPEILAQQDQSDAIIRSQSRETSGNHPEIAGDLDTGILFAPSKTSAANNQMENTPNVLIEEDYSDSLLQRNRAISEDLASGQQSEDIIHPPYIDVSAGVPSTSSYQPLITDGSSAGDQLNSLPGNGEAEGTMGGANESNNSADTLSKYALNAQKLLLSVLLDIMKSDDQRNRYREIRKRFSELPNFENEMSLTYDLEFYLIERKTAWRTKYLLIGHNKTPEYRTLESYEILVKIVVKALLSTVSVKSSLEFDAIMNNYEDLKDLCGIYSQIWEDNSEEIIQDEASRNRVNVLLQNIQELSLHTNLAFQILLMHIGENAKQSLIDLYSEIISLEDKKFLRLNCFLNF